MILNLIYLYFFMRLRNLLLTDFVRTGCTLLSQFQKISEFTESKLSTLLICEKVTWLIDIFSKTYVTLQYILVLYIWTGNCFFFVENRAGVKSFKIENFQCDIWPKIFGQNNNLSWQPFWNLTMAKKSGLYFRHLEKNAKWPKSRAN